MCRRVHLRGDRTGRGDWHFCRARNNSHLGVPRGILLLFSDINTLRYVARVRMTHRRVSQLRAIFCQRASHIITLARGIKGESNDERLSDEWA